MSFVSENIEVIIIAVITIIGWIISHRLILKAQKKLLLNQIKNDARIQIVNSLKEYLNWLEELHNNINNLSTHIEHQNPEKVSTTIDRLNSLINDNLRISAVELLEQYELIFPQTLKVRNYLWNKHIQLFSYVKGLISRIRDEEFIDEIYFILEGFEGIKISAQIWIVKDLIICIQNIALSEISGVKLILPSEKTFGNIEVRHPRVKYDLDGNIFITDAKYSEAFLKKNT